MSDPEYTATEPFVDLSAEVDGDFEVYVNGIAQPYDIDYHLDGRTLVFSRALIPELRMTPGFETCPVSVGGSPLSWLRSRCEERRPAQQSSG